MTEKDIERKYQRETGKYVPFPLGLRPNGREYVNWLLKLIIEMDDEITELKRPKERDHYA